MKQFFLRNREAALAVIIVAMALLVGLRAPVFLTAGNLLDVIDDSSILAILVMGQMVVLLTKGIDLSVASNLALTGMFCSVVGQLFPSLNGFELVIIALVFGGLLGTLNGTLITTFDLPPIVVTLGTLAAYRGAIFVLSKGAWMNDQDIHPAIKALPRMHFLGLSGLVWFAVATLLACWWFFRYRRTGREMYALGGNLSAAAYIGIPIKRRLMQVYGISGALAGLAGILWVGRYSIAFTELAAGYELTVIAACVIGGISTAGGIGSVMGGLLGVLFTGVINGALPVIHVSPFWQQAISGTVILVAVVVNARSERRSGKQILPPKRARTEGTIEGTQGAHS
jgi:rhamnose transport system permease protein